MKNSIYFVVTLVFTMALSMLVLVSGIKFVEVFSPYYGTKSEIWLALGAVSYTSLLVASKAPKKIVNWLRKD